MTNGQPVRFPRTRLARLFRVSCHACRLETERAVLSGIDALTVQKHGTGANAPVNKREKTGLLVEFATHWSRMGVWRSTSGVTREAIGIRSTPATRALERPALASCSHASAVDVPFDRISDCGGVASLHGYLLGPNTGR